MNWNQFIEADRQECIKDAITSLESSMTLITESLESLNESIESINESDCNTDLIEAIKSIKTNLVREQDNIESTIEQLRDYLDS